MNTIYKAYESAIEASEKKDCELNRLRLHFEDKKLKIESLEHELVMSKDECIILKDKCEITYSERNILISDNKHLNAKIDALHNSVHMLEADIRMTHNFRHPWSKAPGLGSEFLKPIVSHLKDLQNLTFMGEVPNIKHSDTPVSPLSPLHEKEDHFTSLIPEFQPIIVKCSDSTPLPPLTNLDLNQIKEFHHSVSNCVDYVP